MVWFPIATLCGAPEYTMQEDEVGPDDDEDKDGDSAAVFAVSEEP
jgi:hypothetical protein